MSAKSEAINMSTLVTPKRQITKRQCSKDPSPCKNTPHTRTSKCTTHTDAGAKAVAIEYLYATKIGLGSGVGLHRT